MTPIFSFTEEGSTWLTSPCGRNHEFFRCVGDDRYIHISITHEPETKRFVANTLPAYEDDLASWINYNCAGWTVNACKIRWVNVGPDGRIVADEPDPDCSAAPQLSIQDDSFVPEGRDDSANRLIHRVSS